MAEAAKLEAVGRMTSGVAHDFNNLLQAMKAALLLLAKRTRSDAQASQIIEQGISSIERGRSLVSQLLGLARPQALQVREIDLNKLLTEITGLLRNAAAPAAQIDLDLAADLNLCHADPFRLEAAILNLVMNARDATPADRPGGGRIRISTMNWDEAAVSIDGRQLEPGQFVRLTVRDDGLGMPRVVLERASEPFFTTKGDRGTGLGLAQVYRFAREVGGGIQIESAPYAGTAVHLFLPCTSSGSRSKTVVGSWFS
jgi:signal transduction histidine kinase